MQPWEAGVGIQRSLDGVLFRVTLFSTLAITQYDGPASTIACTFGARCPDVIPFRRPNAFPLADWDA